jgi:glycosyltransferase involved in cell wall biosynthesis
LWTPWLLRSLAKAGDPPPPTVHTLHDLDPHAGRRFGPLIRTWNTLVMRGAGHLLVHGRSYYDRLLADGLCPAHVTYTPLLHLCFSYATEMRLQVESSTFNIQPSTFNVQPFALFFGRIEAYKGLGVLIAAASRLPAGRFRVVVAGPGRLEPAWMGPLPVQVELRNRLIEDAEALDLLQSCSLVVLPYLSGTQSALIAVAYYFGKPVVVTRTGALPEYVDEGVSGWVVPPGSPPGPLAACLTEALADPARLQRMGAAGREWRQHQRRSETATLTEMYETLERTRSL